MATLKKFLSGFAALAILTSGSALMTVTSGTIANAQASSPKAIVDSAKQRGEIGEQIDGYLGIVDGKSPSADVKNAMREINIARKSVYTKAAANGGTTVAIFAQLTGEKQIKKAAIGHYVRDASRVWKQK